MITAGELALDQHDHEALMWDTCQRLVYTVTGQDAAGQEQADYVDGAVYRCGFDARVSREVTLADMTVVRTEGQLRLPVDAVLDPRDRVRVLSAGGRPLLVPLVLEAVGAVRPGPSGLVVDLRRVTI